MQFLDLHAESVNFYPWLFHPRLLILGQFEDPLSIIARELLDVGSAVTSVYIPVVANSIDRLLLQTIWSLCMTMTTTTNSPLNRID